EEFSPSGVAPRLRKELRIGPDAIVFGSHGKVVRREGFAEFLAAAKIALRRMTRDEAARARFVVIGGAPECRELAARSGISDKVHVLELQDAVREYVVDFDVAVALAAGSSPPSVIEAAAMGE